MGEPFNHQNEFYLSISNWEAITPSLRAGFTSRLGGGSNKPYNTFNQGLHVGDQKADVLANRKKLATALGASLDDWVISEQVHGTTIKHASKDDRGSGARSQDTALASADGLVTDTPGLLCCGLFADCVPLFFFDPVSFRVGIAHAGWKGTVGEIAGVMVEHFAETGSNREDVQVVIGPSISEDAYEVDRRVIDQIPSKYVDQVVKQFDNHHGFLDLKRLNTEILLNHGILRHNVDVTHYCTYRDKHLFFSHRRDEGQTGRMLGFIGFSV